MTFERNIFTSLKVYINFHLKKMSSFLKKALSNSCYLLLQESHHIVWHGPKQIIEYVIGSRDYQPLCIFQYRFQVTQFDFSLSLLNVTSWCAQTNSYGLYVGEIFSSYYIASTLGPIIYNRVLSITQNFSLVWMYTRVRCCLFKSSTVM